MCTYIYIYIHICIYTHSYEHDRTRIVMVWCDVTYVVAFALFHATFDAHQAESSSILVFVGLAFGSRGESKGGLTKGGSALLCVFPDQC